MPVARVVQRQRDEVERCRDALLRAEAQLAEVEARARERPSWWVLLDTAGHNGAPLRRYVAGFLPDHDLFAFATTCGTFSDTAADLGDGRVARPPPGQHVVRSLPLTEWALGSGWAWPPMSANSGKKD